MRQTNAANEIQSIGDEGGWVTPLYDTAGNMIYGPKSGSETTGLHNKYDGGVALTNGVEVLCATGFASAWQTA